MVDISSLEYLPEADTYPARVPRLEDGWWPTGGAVDPANDGGLLNWQAQLLAQRTTWLKARHDERAFTQSIGATVGAGGDYPTLSAALARLSRMQPALAAGELDLRATITLRPGFVLAEQVLVRGLNLGWIKIVATDPTVVVNAQAHVVNVGIDGRATFTGLSGAVMPELACQFSCINVPSGHVGIWVEGGASIVVAPSCGIDHCGSGGAAVALTGGAISAEGARFRQCAGSALTATRAGSISFANGIATAAGIRAAHAHRGGLIDAESANLSGAGAVGVYCLSGARVNAVTANCRRGGSDSSADIAVQDGGTIAARGATGGTNIAPNTTTASGVIYK